VLWWDLEGFREGFRGLQRASERLQRGFREASERLQRGFRGLQRALEGFRGL